MRRLWSRALVAPVVVLIAAMLLAGCSGDSPEPVEPTRPAIPYTMIWSAADGIDVQKRAGELVRAAFDGGEMAAWAGVEHSFPGFADAVAGARAYFGYWGSPHQPPSPDNLPSMENKVLFRHIATLRATDTRISARVCTLQRAVKPHWPPLPDTGPGTFIGKTRPRTLDVELVKPVDASAGAAGQRDRASDRHAPAGSNQPSWNAFGNWRIDAIYDLYGKDRDGTITRRFGTEPECMAWWHQLFPGWSGTSGLTFGPPNAPTDQWSWYNQIAIDPLAPPSFPEWISPKGVDA